MLKTFKSVPGLYKLAQILLCYAIFHSPTPVPPLLPRFLNYSCSNWFAFLTDELSVLRTFKTTPGLCKLAHTLSHYANFLLHRLFCPCYCDSLISLDHISSLLLWMDCPCSGAQKRPLVHANRSTSSCTTPTTLILGLQEESICICRIL